MGITRKRYRAADAAAEQFRIAKSQFSSSVSLAAREMSWNYYLELTEKEEIIVSPSKTAASGKTSEVQDSATETECMILGTICVVNIAYFLSHVSNFLHRTRNRRS